MLMEVWGRISRILRGKSSIGWKFGLRRKHIVMNESFQAAEADFSGRKNPGVSLRT
jgi:hypothetical protein